MCAIVTRGGVYMLELKPAISGLFFFEREKEVTSRVSHSYKKGKCFVMV